MFNRDKIREKAKREAILKKLRKETGFDNFVFNGLIRFDIDIIKEEFSPQHSESTIEITYVAKAIVNRSHILCLSLYLIWFIDLWKEEGFYNSLLRYKNRVEDEIKEIEKQYTGSILMEMD